MGKEKMLCPRWGHCKAIKVCPLERYYELFTSDVYVLGQCANDKVE